jgi:HAD superfamily 5'-nucleotidase-like hydrolase
VSTRHNSPAGLGCALPSAVPRSCLLNVLPATNALSEDALTPASEVKRNRQIFVNRNLRMDKVDLIGFDMDHTLAVYHKRRSEELAFEMTLARLITEKGYPTDIGSIRYDPAFVIRGLIIDKEHGNIIKADRHSHVGRCFHGRQPLEGEARKALYHHEKIRLGASRYAWIDTLFALPEACLYAFIIDLLESEGHKVDYKKLYDDIRDAIDSVHRDGTLKTEIKKDLARYIVKDVELGPALHKLRSAGKKIFLATNSYWDYTQAVMSFLLDDMLPEYPRWEKYFDYIIVGAQKPTFFAGHNPFLELDATGNVVGEATELERGRIYQGGNLLDLERYAGIVGDRVLYVGDHIFGDILKSKKVSLWRTCMIVEELEDEIAHSIRMSPEIRRLHELEAEHRRLDDELNHQKHVLNSIERRLERESQLTLRQREELEKQRKAEKEELDTLRKMHKEVAHQAEALDRKVESSHNPYWGFVFKEGHENSRFGEQVEDYACLYTSRVSNFLFYSPAQYFRAPREIMPHERT